jgi:hypothetical protein
VKAKVYIIIMLVWCGTAFGQTGRITGWVLDAETKAVLELATVTIYEQDSSLWGYQLSDKNGRFTIEKLPLNKKLLVNVSYTGYKNYNVSVQLNTSRTDTLAVLLTINTTDTVVVTAAVPVRMNGDTLEINPAAFKLKQHAVVEELLNQVSGIVIWSDGSITVNGKKVNSLLVEGKPFLGSSDPRIATQNLPKSAIEKIQLYQEYDRSKIGVESQPQDSLLTMNIKLKEGSKKGYFGKAGAGYGTSKRFESDLSFQTYNKKSSAGIGGGFNNINKNIGNIQEMFQNNTFRSSNPNLYNVGRFGSSGINKNHSIGAVFNHNFIETTNSRQNNRIQVNYNKSGTDAYVTDLNLQNRTTINNPQFIREEGVQNNSQNRHDLGFNYLKNNSYSDNLNVNGSVNTVTDKGNSSRFSEVRDSADQLQNTNSTTTQHSRRSDNQSLSLGFSRSDYEEPLKGFTIQLNARRGNSESERDVRNTFQSFTDNSKSTLTNRLYSSNNQSLNLGGTLDYTGFKRLLLGRFNLFRINLRFSQSFNYSRLSDNSVVRDYDSTAKQYILNANLSNQNKRELFEYTPSLTFSRSFNKYSDLFNQSLNFQVRLVDDIKTEKNSSSFAKRNLNRSFQFFRYDGNVSYQYTRRNKYDYHAFLNYTRNFQYPSIDQLYTIVDDINVYSIRIGNPQLRNSIYHNINLNVNFNSRNPKSTYSVNSYIGGGYTLFLDPVADSIINDFSGKRIFYYINADKNRNLNLNYNFNISRKFRKNSLQLMYNGNFNAGKHPNYIDGIKNVSATSSLYNQFNIQYALGSILVINATQALQHNKTSQTAEGLASFKNNSNSTKLGVVVNYPESFTFSSTVDHVVNSALNRSIVLWNAFATYRFMKQQAELKLSAMDLLKQYENITNSVNAFGTTTRTTNGLQRYFLLTFSYYPRKFGKTEMKLKADR